MGVELYKVVCLVGIVLIGSATTGFAENTISATERTSLVLTVYEQDLAYIEEVRTAQFEEGDGLLTCADVPRTIVPESIVVTGAEGVTVVEQSFRYDAKNRYQLLSLYVGQPVTVIHRNEYQDRERTSEAILLSADNPPMYQIGDEVHIGTVDTLVLPLQLTECALLPSLVWKYQSAAAVSQPVAFSYLMRGMSWKANYSLVLTDEESALLSSWVTVVNGAGATFENARVRVLSGAVAHMPQPMPSRALAKAAPMMAGANDAEMHMPQAHGVGDFHVYTLPQPIDVYSHENKQVPLFDDSVVQYEKEYRATSRAHGHYQVMREPSQPVPVAVYIHIQNTQSAGLGMPLPAGELRVYEPSDMAKFFVGEVSVDRIPTDEKLSFKHGEASDIFVERTQTAFEQVARNRYESAWAVSVRNRSDEPKTVIIREEMNGSWKVLESSHAFEKKSSRIIDCPVTVSPGQEERVTFELRVDM